MVIQVLKVIAIASLPSDGSSKPTDYIKCGVQEQRHQYAVGWLSSGSFRVAKTWLPKFLGLGGGPWANHVNERVANSHRSETQRNASTPGKYPQKPHGFTPTATHLRRNFRPSKSTLASCSPDLRCPVDVNERQQRIGILFPNTNFFQGMMSTLY